MEDGRNGMNGEPAVRVVEVESNNEHVNAAILRPNMVVEFALVTELIREPATHNFVLLMVGGRSGECGENARRPVEVDKLTDYVGVQIQVLSMVVNDAQVPQFNQNNVERSIVRSMEVGVIILHIVLAPRHVEVEPPQVFATAPNLPPSTMDFPVLEQHRKQKHATLNTVRSMENTPRGQSGHNAAILAEVEHKPETASAHHPSTVVKDARFLATPPMNANVTLNCVL